MLVCYLPLPTRSDSILVLPLKSVCFLYFCFKASNTFLSSYFCLLHFEFLLCDPEWYMNCSWYLFNAQLKGSILVSKQWFSC